MAAIAGKKHSKIVDGALALARQVRRLPASELWLDYDAEADVLYVSLATPQRATRTVDLDEEGILLRYRGKKLVGITVMDASKR